MCVFFGSKNFLGVFILRNRIGFFKFKEGDWRAILSNQRYLVSTSSFEIFRNVKKQGDRPRRIVCKPHTVQYVLVIVESHKTRDRAEYPLSNVENCDSSFLRNLDFLIF